MSKIIIPIACDHGGYALKSFLVEKLSASGYCFEDMGTHSSDSVDYPDFAHLLSHSIEQGDYLKGILICGSGNGIQMAANKHSGIRAALCWNAEIAELARLHNDANILVMPGRFIDFEEALRCVEVFFSTDFEGGRHQCRVEKIPIKL